NLRPKIAVRLQIPMLPKNDEDGFAWVNENPALDKVEHPFSQTRRQERMARPVCKGICRDRPLISLLQRIRPRRIPPGQDGDTRALVLINFPASNAVF